MIPHMQAILTIMLAMIIISACSQSGSTTGGSESLPPQVQEARMLIRDDYPRASYYRIKMNYTRDDENVSAWTNDSDWIYLSSNWIEIADRDMVHAACILVHEWWHTKGHGETSSENKETECKATI